MSVRTGRESATELYDGPRYAVGDDLPVERIGHRGPFVLVANKAAFDEYGGVFGIAQYRKIRRFYAAVSCFHILDKLTLHQLGEFFRGRGAVKGFDTECGGAV